MKPVNKPQARGSLAIIGGRFEADNDALFAALRKRCNSRIAILATASGYPEEVGEETVDEFRAQGFYAELIPVFYDNRQLSPFDDRNVERLRAFGSVYFTGGDQARIMATLIQNGAETPLLSCIREVVCAGRIDRRQLRRGRDHVRAHASRGHLAPRRQSRPHRGR